MNLDIHKLFDPSPPNPTCFAIKSTNVVLGDDTEPTEAIILIEDEKILDVIIAKETDPTAFSDILSKWSVKDYGSLVIFPGLIDSNVYLHADFEGEWENIAYCTDLAAFGGVTTIVDNPIMCKPYKSAEDYIKNLNQRITTIQEISRIDFGVLGILDPQTEDYTQEIANAGVLGFKCYLMSCFQNTVGNFEIEAFQPLLEKLGSKHKDHLLMVHPEVATNRELYLTSPCRTVPLKNRLDADYDVKSIDIGGAANRGSYFEEFNKKEQSVLDGTDLIEPAELTIDSPSQLKSKVKKVRENMEIDDIVSYELQSYDFGKQETESNQCCDRDYLDDLMQKGGEKELIAHLQEFGFPDQTNESLLKKKEPAKGKLIKPSLSAEIGNEIQKYDLKVDNPRRKTDSTDNRSPHKKSRFASISFEDIRKSSNTDIKKEGEEIAFNLDQVEEKLTIPEELNEENPFEEKCKRLVCQTSIEALPSGEDLKISASTKIGDESPYGHGSITLHNDNFGLSEDFQLNEINREASSSKGALSLISHGYNDEERIEDSKSMYEMPEHQHGSRMPRLSLGLRRLTASLEQIHIPSFKQDKSLGTIEIHSLTSSPLVRKHPLTPANSSLLGRRMSRKESGDTDASMISTMSSTARNYNHINSLDINKSPISSSKKEAKLNQNYQVFLANRPQSWEENAVSIILSAVKKDTSMRVVLQNLSLASSFLMIRDKKKANPAFNDKIIGDTSPAYLSLSSNMIAHGETKFKVSPPIRRKENRDILVENTKLGGTDMLSSYNFFVPPRYRLRSEGNFRTAFGGLETIGCSLQATWTSLYYHQYTNNPKFKEDADHRKKTVDQLLRDMSKMLCSNPARVLRISDRKGKIQKGMDADLIVWDPYKIQNYDNLSKSHLFSGKQLIGSVLKTYLRGNLIYNQMDDAEVTKTSGSKFITPQTVSN